MRRLPLLLSTLFAACVAGTTGSLGDAPEIDLDDPGREESLRIGEDALLDRAEATPAAIDEDALDAEEEAQEEALDELPLAPIEEALAADDVAPIDDPIPGVGVAAPLPPTDAELAAMARLGVQHVRVALPYPAGTDWAAPNATWVAAVDGLFADAARHGVTLLPVLIATEIPAIDDASLTAWGDYAFHLAARYGDAGDLWEERADLEPAPPHAWEVWSEPNRALEADHYRALLLYARVGLRDGDPDAKVLVGGLAPAGGDATPPGAFLESLLDAPDAEQLFEGVAVHPFARDVVAALAVLSDVRRVLDDHALDTAGIWVTAAGWAVGGASAIDARDEADRVHKTRALLDGVARLRDTLRLGPVFWAAHRDLSLAETGGVDGWSARVGLFDVDGAALLATERGDAFLGLTTAALPLTLRPAPGRAGAVRTATPTRQARRDDGRRRARERHFRHTVLSRMFQLGQCTRRDPATGLQTMRRGCDPFTVAAADRYRWTEHPEWDEETRRVQYVCGAISRMRPDFVSGLVRFNRDHVLAADASVAAEIEREARMFRRVRHCVRQRVRSRRGRVRFDVVLNSLHYTHTQSGVTSGSEGRRLHREVLETLDPLLRPDAWFYDFYTDPYDGHRLCYGQSTDCREGEQRFWPTGMDAGIEWAHEHGQWVGGNTFRGEHVPRDTDYVAVTYASDGFTGVIRDRDRARADQRALPVLMHLRNDPQIEGSEGHLLFEGDGAVQTLLRRHFERQEAIGYGYMAPVFFSLRYTDDPATPVASFDPRARGLLRFMRRQQRTSRPRP